MQTFLENCNKFMRNSTQFVLFLWANVYDIWLKCDQNSRLAPPSVWLWHDLTNFYTSSLKRSHRRFFVWLRQKKNYDAQKIANKQINWKTHRFPSLPRVCAFLLFPKPQNKEKIHSNPIKKYLANAIQDNLNYTSELYAKGILESYLKTIAFLKSIFVFGLNNIWRKS